jgi:hypothetical protein
LLLGTVEKKFAPDPSNNSSASFLLNEFEGDQSLQCLWWNSLLHQYRIRQHSEGGQFLSSQLRIMSHGWTSISLSMTNEVYAPSSPRAGLALQIFPKRPVSVRLLAA